MQLVQGTRRSWLAHLVTRQSALYAVLHSSLLCSVHLTYILHSLSTRSLITSSTLLSSLIENTRQDEDARLISHDFNAIHRTF